MAGGTIRASTPATTGPVHDVDHPGAGGPRRRRYNHHRRPPSASSLPPFALFLPLFFLFLSSVARLVSGFIGSRACPPPDRLTCGGDRRRLWCPCPSWWPRRFAAWTAPPRAGPAPQGRSPPRGRARPGTRKGVLSKLESKADGLSRMRSAVQVDSAVVWFGLWRDAGRCRRLVSGGAASCRGPPSVESVQPVVSGSCSLAPVSLPAACGGLDDVGKFVTG